MSKPTKFDPVKYQAKKTAQADLRKIGAQPATIAALRDRVKKLEAVVGI